MSDARFYEADITDFFPTTQRLDCISKSINHLHPLLPPPQGQGALSPLSTPQPQEQAENKQQPAGANTSVSGRFLSLFVTHCLHEILNDCLCGFYSAGARLRVCRTPDDNMTCLQRLRPWLILVFCVLYNPHCSLRTV